ncbi:MAG TPA: hypothetical protein VFL13_15575 [Candidatus Baltobacteraceae bacterium]|nr:hypothetical protein [Candidatus Baltobacteraceae bacterium]
MAVLVATPQPSPTPAVTPLKVIERVRSTPFCTALGDNIKHSIETLLADDDAFKQAEPLFEQAANDLEFAGDMESSFNDPHPARSHANARLTFDIAHLRDRATSIVENLKKIDDLLSDAKRFPSAASTDEQRRLLALRDQLLKIAKAQNETLNVITGTAEEYAMDDLFSRDVSANGALSANGAKSPDAGLFQGGPMNAPQATPAPGVQTGPASLNAVGAAAASMTLSGAQLNGQFKDPRLQSLAFNNVLGRIYADYVREEQREQKLEASFTPHLLEAARLCKP